MLNPPDELFNIVMKYCDGLIAGKKVPIKTVIAEHPYLTKVQKDELQARLFLVNIFKKEYIQYRKQMKKDMEEIWQMVEKHLKEKGIVK